MMKRMLAFVLVLGVLCPAAQPPAAKANTLSTGTVVILRLTSGEEVRGRLLGATAEAVTVMAATADTVSERAIPASEIKSIRQPSNKVRDVFAVIGGFYLVLHMIAVTVLLASGN
ncbi:MAG TPA: hypothetical protein PKJ41_03485 [Bryobacteraceae bacterium]|nr:hypothetical protein [Bryobacteraceae bacterium]HPT26190.1 hypothetical protein [Bryobacteraceae bacterium]